MSLLLLGCFCLFEVEMFRNAFCNSFLVRPAPPIVQTPVNEVHARLPQSWHQYGLDNWSIAEHTVLGWHHVDLDHRLDGAVQACPIVCCSNSATCSS